MKDEEVILDTIIPATGWISVNDLLPPNKEGWSHSEQVLVHYDSEPNCFVENYGIAYYHYERPFAEPGFVDFHFPYRKPTHWMSIPPIMKKSKGELQDELASLKERKRKLEHQVQTEFSMAARYADEELGQVCAQIKEIEKQL